MANLSKVCLINPPTTDPRETSFYFPMALLTLGGVLREQGVAAELWDFDLFYKKAPKTTEREFRRMLHHGVDGVGTPIFAISSICSNLPMALWMAREIKARRPESLIILGGPQPSSVPTVLLEQFPFLDVIAVGEGEKTLEELIDAGFDPGRFAEIPGLAYRRGGKACLSAKRKLVPNMDELPFPDYSLIDFEEYVTANGGSFIPNVEVGRGCPFHCNFCSTSLMWEKDFRVKSPSRILREMEWLHERYGATHHDFIHDNFTTSRKFVLDFCAYLESHNHLGLKWAASSRTDCLDVKRLETMHQAGLYGLFFGIETGSERMQAIIKKNLDFEHFEPILHRGNELGIAMTTAFILGFPEEREADLDQTVLRALHYKSLGTSRVFFSKLAALTGTEIYRNYLNRLERGDSRSSACPENYLWPFLRESINGHPELFSSFYHVPHCEWSQEEIYRFTEFAQSLVG